LIGFYEIRGNDLKRIIILGGHGDGIVVASALKDLTLSNIDVVPFGFLNDFEQCGTTINGLPVLGKIDDATQFLGENDIYFVSALLKVKEAYTRSQKIRNLKIPINRFFTIIHPQATISRSSKIGYGTYIGPNVTIMPNSTIGNHCSLRASANVGHDCNVGDFCYMGPNSTLAGRVELEQGVHVGPNACILENTKMGMYSVIGLGAAVIKDLPSFTVAFGNPARIIERLKAE
jgi:acetyltransferase EpsM